MTILQNTCTANTNEILIEIGKCRNKHVYAKH